MEDVPEYRIDVDWEKAGALGVPISSIQTTIAAAFGSAYVNDFIQAGRVKRVYVQADAPYPHAARAIWKSSMCATRPARWCPLPLLPSGHWTSGSPKLERYNGFPSINIWGEAGPGAAVPARPWQAMEEIVTKLAPGGRV